MSDDNGLVGRPVSHVKRYLCDLDQYMPGTPAEVVARKHGLDPSTLVKLASNENPHGMSLKASEAALQAVKTAHRYPDDYALLQALAEFYGVDPLQIILGNGSNNVLDLIARTFLGEGTDAVASEYAYAFYKIVVETSGAKHAVAPSKDYAYDLDAMLAAISPQTRVTWVNNPANPIGSFIPYDAIHDFIGKVPDDIIVVLDEAYAEYLSRDLRTDTVTWLKEFPNLILVRTFSKIYGLAGLRIGYALASHEIADILNRVALPFNHNGPSMAAAVAALADQNFIQFSADGNASGREQLGKGLQKLGLDLLPSYGNFITVRTGRANEIAHELETRGVITRPLVAYGLPEWLRITIGMHHQNSRLLSELEEVLAIKDLSAHLIGESSISTV